MAKRRKPKPTRASKLEAAQREYQRAMRRCKVDHLRAKGTKAAPVAFADLSCAREGLAPCGDRVSPNGYKRSKQIAVPEGFHIGYSHKSGLQIFPDKEREWSNGRKS